MASTVVAPKAVEVAVPEGGASATAGAAVSAAQPAANAEAAVAEAAAAVAAGAAAVERFSSPPLTQLLSDLHLKNTSTAVVYRVVLTGGPCGYEPHAGAQAQANIAAIECAGQAACTHWIACIYRVRTDVLIRCCRLDGLASLLIFAVSSAARRLR
jgi:hypothetical protein